MRRIALATCLILSAAAGCTRGTPSAEAEEPKVTTSPLPSDFMSPLKQVGWDQRAASRLGLWVSVARQRLYGIQSGEIVFEFPCSTAARGVGNQTGSYRTPLGWHAVEERIGDGLPVGAVLREREYTGRVWTPSARAEGDMILTRILWLRGLEPGINAGPGIDSHDRYIYIHGTPDENRIGRPASFGCVRMKNADVITLFDRAPSGTPVLITEW